MEFIKKLLFGRPTYFEDFKIGKLKTRVKSENPSIEYTWVGEHLLPHQKEKTVFILEGNIYGPSKSQLESAHKILDELQSIVENIDAKLQSNSSNYSKISDWKENFFFTAVTPNNQRNNGFELNFEPLDQDDTRYVGCMWTNGRITEIEGK